MGRPALGTVAWPSGGPNGDNVIQVTDETQLSPTLVEIARSATASGNVITGDGSTVPDEAADQAGGDGWLGTTYPVTGITKPAGETAVWKNNETIATVIRVLGPLRATRSTSSCRMTTPSSAPW